MRPDIRIEAGPEPCCDFCSVPEVHARYDVDNFVIEEFASEAITQVSEGAWNACRPCSEFIDAGNWDGLVERVFSSMVCMYPELKQAQVEIRAKLKKTYSQLQKFRKLPS